MTGYLSLPLGRKTSSRRMTPSSIGIGASQWMRIPSRMSSSGTSTAGLAGVILVHPRKHGWIEQLSLEELRVALSFAAMRQHARTLERPAASGRLLLRDLLEHPPFRLDADKIECDRGNQVAQGKRME